MNLNLQMVPVSFLLKLLSPLSVKQTLDLESDFGVPSALLFIFCAWLSLPSIAKSGPGDIPRNKKRAMSSKKYHFNKNTYCFLTPQVFTTAVVRHVSTHGEGWSLGIHHSWHIVHGGPIWRP